ncbi:uncharacterized protein LOC106131288 isoform X1 [Amyelois transitella]|uniref:uncharacterized protein LOC106131288 isoform X1 n=1 Tax=Amyelois transitella TaxID=680683 RepID=UPI00067CF64E|nr:uncharacterized protein LOC106131288 isoform X1 [Amyelois transitella]
MPASNIDLYHMQDARNNFDAMRPAPVCADANQFMGQCQNIHISTNCYYGFHDAKRSETNHVTTDCEMFDVPHANNIVPAQSNNRKRSADDIEYPQSKRHREEVQRERNIEPETNENKILEENSEDLLETLYWNIHGGNIFHIAQCI